MLAILAPAILAPSIVACRAEAGADPVDVLYAGSLTAIMERELGPAYIEATGRRFRGEGRGSLAGAHQIRESVRRPDAYITADTGTLAVLGEDAPGWSIAFARGEMAIGYSSRGRMAAALDSAAAARLEWHEVVVRPGFRLGRTDPELDPKGYRTIWMFELAERHYERPGLSARLLEFAGPDRVFPEENLAVRVETGQLDAGVFYRAEARAHGLNVVRLPPEVNLGSPEHGGLYARHTYRDRDGRVFRGAPILYAVTIPTSAPDPDAAASFIRFLLDERARDILSRQGYVPLIRVLGDSARARAALGTDFPP